ncbi:hypothetical protein C1645_811119 [Glomus cerebriforme]|uniref:DUF659 domain-containing protein n=1 Tax=Glomus cerebriforme TaxID=658196 RepID=A0A397TX58_9GLOM|nr:hypothetical protein C1645_811119 [Glomus cerebriforme]
MIAVDISSECENYMTVINKVELIFHKLKSKDITVYAIVTDSASAYTAARKCIAIAIFGKTRWNSLYYICTSLLKMQQVLQLNYSDEELTTQFIL